MTQILPGAAFSFAPADGVVQRFRFPAAAISDGDAVEYVVEDEVWLRIALRDIEDQRRFEVTERVAGRWGAGRVLPPAQETSVEPVISVRFAGGTMWFATGTEPPICLHPSLVLPGKVTLNLSETVSMEADPRTPVTAGREPPVTTHEDAPLHGTPHGWLEAAGSLPGTKFMLLLGWLRERGIEQLAKPGAIELHLSGQVAINGAALIAFHDREDLKSEGVGFIAMLPVPDGTKAIDPNPTLKMSIAG